MKVLPQYNMFQSIHNNQQSMAKRHYISFSFLEKRRVCKGIDDINNEFEECYMDPTTTAQGCLSTLKDNVEQKKNVENIVKILNIDLGKTTFDENNDYQKTFESILKEYDNKIGTALVIDGKIVVLGYYGTTIPLFLTVKDLKNITDLNLPLLEEFSNNIKTPNIVNIFASKLNEKSKKNLLDFWKTHSNTIELVKVPFPLTAEEIRKTGSTLLMSMNFDTSKNTNAYNFNPQGPEYSGDNWTYINGEVIWEEK